MTNRQEKVLGIHLLNIPLTFSALRCASSPLRVSAAALNLAASPVAAASISAIFDSFSASST